MEKIINPPEYYKYIESELDIRLKDLFPRILYNIKASVSLTKEKLIDLKLIIS